MRSKIDSKSVPWSFEELAERGGVLVARAAVDLAGVGHFPSVDEVGDTRPRGRRSRGAGTAARPRAERARSTRACRRATGRARRTGTARLPQHTRPTSRPACRGRAVHADRLTSDHHLDHQRAAHRPLRRSSGSRSARSSGRSRRRPCDVSRRRSVPANVSPSSCDAWIRRRRTPGRARPTIAATNRHDRT